MSEPREHEGLRFSTAQSPAMIGAPGRRMLRLVLPVVPSVVYLLAMFVYPFAYGVLLSLRPAKGAGGLSLANYAAFLGDAWQARTIWVTASIAVPNTLVTVALALVVAYAMRRGIWAERTITALLVLPIALGTVLVAEGINGFYGPKGWLNQLLVAVGVSEAPRLTHNYTGVMIALFVQHFPFCFLMLLGYISGIDPALEQSARVLGARPWVVFRRVMWPLIAPGAAIAFALVFVMNFGVFPSAVLVGQPAGPTRTIAIAAYQQAFEHYDMSMASAIAVIMGLCQLLGLAVVLSLRSRTVATGMATVGVGKR
jgi:putative spermidine/putrescine transport system permease protein